MSSSEVTHPLCFCLLLTGFAKGLTRAQKTQTDLHLQCNYRKITLFKIFTLCTEQERIVTCCYSIAEMNFMLLNLSQATDRVWAEV